jgi:hypothetical protein
VQYQSVPQVLAQMKGCLASGYPFVYGFTVYESFESTQVAQTGLCRCPRRAKKCWEATRCWLWDMTTARSDLSCGTPGGPDGA